MYLYCCCYYYSKHDMFSSRLYDREIIRRMKLDALNAAYVLYFVCMLKRTCGKNRKQCITEKTKITPNKLITTSSEMVS